MGDPSKCCETVARTVNLFKLIEQLFSEFTATLPLSGHKENMNSQTEIIPKMQISSSILSLQKYKNNRIWNHLTSQRNLTQIPNFCIHLFESGKLVFIKRKALKYSQWVFFSFSIFKQLWAVELSLWDLHRLMFVVDWEHYKIEWVGCKNYPNFY